MEKKLFGAYHLERLNGELCPVKASLVLKEGPGGVEVVSDVANTLQGVVKFGAGKLRGVIASTTVMTGCDKQMEVEKALVSGFGSGLVVQLAGGMLTLAGKQDSFVFYPDLTTERLFGKYTLETFNGESVANDDVVLEIVPSREGFVLVIAQFGKSLRGELRLEDCKLRGVLASTLNASGGVMKEMEQRFDAGMECGMHVSLNWRRLVLRNDHGVFSYLRSLLPDDLVGDYVLESINGLPVRYDCQRTLAFSLDAEEGCIGVVAKVPGVLHGKTQLVKETLRGVLMADKVPDKDTETSVGGALISGFEAGFCCTLDAGQLTLRCDANVLVYTKAAVMPYEIGKPEYWGDSVTPCLGGHGNGLLFRIINTRERKWAFYNDTLKYNMRIVVHFGSRSKIKSLGNTCLTVGDDGRYVAEVSVAPGATEMFIAGHVNGYKCFYDALLI